MRAKSDAARSKEMKELVERISTERKNFQHSIEALTLKDIKEKVLSSVVELISKRFPCCPLAPSIVRSAPPHQGGAHPGGQDQEVVARRGQREQFLLSRTDYEARAARRVDGVPRAGPRAHDQEALYK